MLNSPPAIEATPPIINLTTYPNDKINNLSGHVSSPATPSTIPPSQLSYPSVAFTSSFVLLLLLC